MIIIAKAGFEASNKPQVAAITSSLANLRGKLTNSQPETIEKISKERTRLSTEEIEGFLSDIGARLL